MDKAMSGRVATLLILTATAASMVWSGAGAAELWGTAWLADDIGGRGVVDRARSTLHFDESRRVSGSTGCNRFFGPVELDGDRISFGNLATTRMACPDALMDQERRFLEALSKAKRLELTHEGQILLVHGEGARPVLRLSRLVDK
jgi:heat shock protein HslJ